MTYSLNEIEAMGKRAARGAGLPWGLAEEAGKATRWLSTQDLPGPDLLFHVLVQNDGKPPNRSAPVSTDGVWRAPSGPLCPLVAGAALCDLASEMADGRMINLGLTLQPLLLAPYLAMAAKTTGATFELNWDDFGLLADAEYISWIDGETVPAACEAQTVRCRRANQSILQPREHVSGLAVPTNVWGGLNDFALRTFAPATEASRVAGAGAGLTDND